VNHLAQFHTFVKFIATNRQLGAKGIASAIPKFVETQSLTTYLALLAFVRNRKAIDPAQALEGDPEGRAEDPTPPRHELRELCPR
jgi:hypothetical protein